MLGQFSYPLVCDSKDAQQIVCQTIIKYFNDLGEKLIEVMEAGDNTKTFEADPTCAYNMRQMGCASTILNADFTGGTEYRICKKLFGAGDGGRCSYHWYFDNIYKLTCKEFNWIYVGYETTLIQRAIVAHEKQKITNASRTFKDLYNFIQSTNIDDDGFHMVSRETALHINDDKTQVDVCRKGINGVWITLANFVFYPNEGVVVVHAPITTSEGETDEHATNNWKVLTNVAISQIRKTPEMEYGSKIRKIIFSALE